MRILVLINLEFSLKFWRKQGNREGKKNCGGRLKITLMEVVKNKEWFRIE